MIFIFGRYVRDKMLPPTSDRCPHCQNVTQINWRRHYKTFHFFFFPMFSFGERVTAGCGICGYTVAAPHPWPLPPLGFLDRLGFLVPFIVLGGGLLGSCVLLGAVAATAPPPPPQTAEDKDRTQLEINQTLGKSYGETPEATALADAVMASLVKDQHYKKEDVAVAVQITAERRVFVDVKYMNLSELKIPARKELVNDLKTLIDPKLKEGDHLVLAVKGFLLYGIVAHGKANEDWDMLVGEDVTFKDVETALKTESDAGAPSALATPSASASAAPVVSASAAPSASASAAPPKKKKKKAPKPAASAAE